MAIKVNPSLYSTSKRGYIQAKNNLAKYFTEFQKTSRSISLQGNKIKKCGVKTDQSLKDSRSLIAKIRKQRAQVSEKRKVVTRVLRTEEEAWIDYEKRHTEKLVVLELQLIEINDFYIKKQENKIQKIEQNIIGEKNKNIARESELIEMMHISEADKCNHLATIRIQFELEAQSKLQKINKIPGRRKIVAQINKDFVNWQAIVEKYIEDKGFSGLEFLLNNLIADQPEIEGVYYKEIMISVNRE